jgi:hypothetical protein
LHDILPIALVSIVNNVTEHPILAAASEASIPA